MSLSKEVIVPVRPNDIANIQREARTGSPIKPGRLVTRTGSASGSHEVEKIDLKQYDVTVASELDNFLQDVHADPEITWIDQNTRLDASKTHRYNPDNNTVHEWYLQTCITQDFLADVNNDVLEGDAPTAGDIVIKSLATDDSSEGGLYEVLSADALSTRIQGTRSNTDPQDFLQEDLDGLRVGTVQGSGDNPGYTRIQFELG